MGYDRTGATAPAVGSLSSSSHASVAHTATRPSSQGPASALRFNYYPKDYPRRTPPRIRCSDTAVFASSGRPLTHALGHL